MLFGSAALTYLNVRANCSCSIDPVALFFKVIAVLKLSIDKFLGL